MGFILSLCHYRYLIGVLGGLCEECWPDAVLNRNRNSCFHHLCCTSPFPASLHTGCSHSAFYLCIPWSCPASFLSLLASAFFSTCHLTGCYAYLSLFGPPSGRRVVSLGLWTTLFELYPRVCLRSTPSDRDDQDPEEPGWKGGERRWGRHRARPRGGQRAGAFESLTTCTAGPWGSSYSPVLCPQPAGHKITFDQSAHTLSLWTVFVEWNFVSPTCQVRP